MIKQIPIYLYGSIIFFVGVFLFNFENTSFQTITITLGISFIVGSLLAIITAFVRERHQVQFAYHEMHALAMLVYGISVLLFCNSTEKLIAFTTFLFMFYAFSEIIFCIWLFNLAQKVNGKIAIIRVLLGLIIGIGTVVAMGYNEFSIKVFGILFILLGINTILYVPVMKVKISK